MALGEIEVDRQGLGEGEAVVLNRRDRAGGVEAQKRFGLQPGIVEGDGSWVKSSPSSAASRAPASRLTAASTRPDPARRAHEVTPT